MKKKFITDAISLEIEIGDNKLLQGVKVVELDPEVFFPLDIENKVKMSWFVDMLSKRIMETLSDPRLIEGGEAQPVAKEGGVVMVGCPYCGHKIEVKRPCCNAKTSTELCPGCHRPVKVTW